MAEFEQALSQYRQLVIDMDGDGIPDAPAPLRPPMQPPESFRQQLQRDPRGAFDRPQPEIRSYTPTPGDHVRQATGSDFAGQATNAMLQYGPIPAQEFVNQPFRTGTAINEAIQDPSLANVTNAGVQSAMTFGMPMTAARVAGAGLGVAAARDLGLDPFSSASAQEPPQTESAPQAPDEMTQILTRQQGLIQQRDAARAQMEAEGRTGKGPRYQAAKTEYDQLNTQVLALDERVNQIRQANSPEAQLAAQQALADEEEYRRSIQRAETMRDEERGRQRRFNDTNVGQVFDEMGGFAVPAAGVLGGMVARGGMSLLPRASSHLAREAAPILGGAAAGASAMLGPLYYEQQSAPKENPERRALLTYARELPPNHPRKQEFLDYGLAEPEVNPVWSMANDQLSNHYMENAAKGVGEGVLGGFMGGHLYNIGARTTNAMLGRGAAAPAGAPTNKMLQGAGQASPPPAKPANLHASHFQPRNQGKFAGPPQYPKGHPRNP